ncbi:tRNA(Arg) A34 adenosine deaminase TadA [Streptomyces sp. SAI-208]|uniref:nucleoside deaminase n=1 Tax=unclassified Streptomyces TaxID=2593676 RepID=UPI002472F870|nr:MULTISPECIES: nucleoside deaminase [unclassified Streptomyces]MDH6515273.1 tRNA(Arg) A34 adenosine deaminase TadA [Streptomyces sp. SAI-090]MDH6547486.1 tRNA(Arg) A34 adenosine deaminase TadA [Streptomyces sp. SAI-041]MDH6606115.1 tRNA(Arg) A34 adenosine deaminase TadA [Streptomyces sp. SAI-208]MDH6620641.1 tRNA(Arg) A34 adenosine deaminase TadA [Streptomyces sp. SAI-135]
MIDIAREYRVALPDWIDEELAHVPAALPSREDRMRLVHRLADRNWREGDGGPFAALVAERESGRIVSAGVNVVLSSGVSSAHAEVVALGLAQAATGSWDLGGDGLPPHELVVNWRPCVQCYGATMWSGVRGLVVAGEGPELEELTTFDEGPLGADWAEQFETRGIEVVGDVLRDGALAVFRDYREAIDAGEVVVYNARGKAG